MGFKVRGFAAVFRNKDLAGEIIDPGAFTDWLKANPSTALRIYWNHNHRYGSDKKPIGITTKLVQKSKGLWFEGELADTPDAREVAELLKQGPMQASFYYGIVDRYKEKGVWHLKALNPHEVGPVNFAANPKAYIEALPGQETTEPGQGQES
jgi:HK97 family phage prohead protease